jgi:sigma-E factor negative regulatory protein RseA
MSQSINQIRLDESLSALVDGEASEIEVHRLLAESQQNTNIRECWHRYQLARAVLKGEVVDLATTQFADRIYKAVAQIDFDQIESVSMAPFHAQKPFGAGKKQTGRWKSNAGRVAIAASVAAAVLVGYQQFTLLNESTLNKSGTEEFARQAMDQEPATPNTINIPAINVQNVSGGDVVLQRSRLPHSLQYSPNVQQQQLQDEQIRRYIRQLMLEHAGHSAQNSGSGLLPYARVPVEDER